ncbi:MAG: ABC transporter ATP-binding protein [Oscillospiraceae bacterium]|jgi:urea transport system ATP-binding protein|nr:ABC transporter ATP-binding protein [Oscillospiraceae bacterium]
MEDFILEVENLSASYGTSRALRDISFQIGREDIVALIGRNGVGKTTLLKCLMGVLRPDSGVLRFCGGTERRSAHAMSAAGVAYVPQGREIFSDFTVRENLRIGAINEKKAVVDARFEQILAYFPALIPHLERKGGVLSGGQQQQLAIGRALMSEPKLLLLDEPTEGIQPNVVAQIADILERVHKTARLPILLVEQNLKFAMRYANRFICMQKGRIVAEGASGELTDELIDKYLKV